MARPLRIEYPGAFYHVIQRGNDKRDIFISEQDRVRFYHYLSLLHERYKANIHTYCLMSNHYHLVLETTQANLSKAMHHLNTSYTIYFNLKRKRSGHFFQGRYKAILVDANEYLDVLSRYIHLNPVRAGLVKDPAQYPHSSYKYFTTNIKKPDWLRTDLVFSSFGPNNKKAKALYKAFVLEGIGKESNEIVSRTAHGLILGSNDFIETVCKKYIKDKKDKEIPALNALRKEIDPSFITRKVSKVIGNKKTSKKISIYLIRKHTSLSLKDTASMFNNISDAAVSAIYHRVDKDRVKDKALNRQIIEIERNLGFM